MISRLVFPSTTIMPSLPAAKNNNLASSARAMNDRVLSYYFNLIETSGEGENIFFICKASQKNNRRICNIKIEFIFCDKEDKYCLKLKVWK